MISSLAEEIIRSSEGKTHLFFLGQAGFILKSKNGTLLAIDLYLSDCVERHDGFKRLMPKLLKPNEVVFDYILATHPHYDHFDVDAVPGMMRNGRTKMFASLECDKEIKRLGIDTKNVTYISTGNGYEAEDIHIECVFCDHGTSAKDAVGLVITIDKMKIYVTGDTCLRLDKSDDIMKYGPFNIMIAPINGTFGNLNESDMISLCEYIKPALVIPCHYWNFAEHYGDPGLFVKLLKERLPHQRYLLMAMGERYIIE